jgi:AraC-like DNA-binding protein
MLPKYLKVLPEENSSIHVRYEKCRYFDNPWHFHPELELNLIVKSTGTRFVGDGIGNFGEGDLVLLGSNIPHYWRNDESYFEKNDEGAARAIIIRFKEQFLGRLQNQIPELQPLDQLFTRAKRGLLIHGNGKKEIITLMQKLPESHGLEKLIDFLQILHLIMHSCKVEFLSSEGFLAQNSHHEDRLNQVYHYIIHNFRQKVTLVEIAAEANMHPAAFSRYFSQSTGKTVSGLIQELRLGHACRSLMESNRSITDIIFESGFQNQANFNKLFLRKMGIKPSEYRKLHRQSRNA